MLDLQSTFEDIGGFGLFQALVCFTGSITCCSAGFFIAGGAFHNLLTCSSVLQVNGTYDNSTSNASNATISSGNHGFKTSVSVEYNLCDDQSSLGELSSVFLLAGCIPGSLLAGPVADVLGRIPGTLIGLLGTVSMNILATFAPLFWLHLASRLICGFFVSWTLGSIFVYGNEVLMTVHRSRFVKLYNLGPAIGSIIIAYLAYVLRDYKRLMIANNFMVIPSVLIVALLPESPSWLMSQRNKSADQVNRALQRIAWINRRPLPERAGIALVSASPDQPQETENAASSPPSRTGRSSLCIAIKSLMADKTVLAQLLSTCLYGFSGGFAYYGFIFVITHAVPNIYLTFALMGAIEPPSLLLLNTFSRSRTLFVSALGTVIACASLGVVFAFVSIDEASVAVSVVMIALAVGGKFTSNVSFCAIVAVGAEIFPTAVRNTGLGLLMATLRTGCMLSPLVNFIPHVPSRFAVLGFACLLAAFPVRILPDTRVRDLTDKDARTRGSTIAARDGE